MKTHLYLWLQGLKPVYLNLFYVIFVAAEPVLDTIKWSEALDDIFKRNYFSDPALSFQYFGSSLGVMRSYPGEKCYGMNISWMLADS